MNKNLALIIRNDLYAAIPAVLAVYATGSTGLKSLGLAAAVAVLGPIVKAANPKDTSFGVGAAKLVLGAVVAEQAKAPAKKVAKKAVK